MKYETKEEIIKRINDYDLRKLIDTLSYVKTTEKNILENIELQIYTHETVEDFLAYLQCIQECIYNKIFNSKN